MFDQLDEFDIAQQVRMERQAGHLGAFLLVEGKNDEKVLYKFISDETCELVIAGKKRNVVGAIQQLDEDGFLGALGIVDTDFVGAEYESENLLSTGVRDLDVLVFNSQAFDYYLYERADPKKLEDFVRSRGMEIRDIVYESCFPIGCLWIVRHHMQADLKLKDLSFDFVNKETLVVDEEALLTEVFAQSRRDIDQREVRRRFELAKRQNYPKECVCRGHDLATVVGIALKNCIADLNAPYVDVRTRRSEVEFGWRLAFGDRQFFATDLAQSIRDWEDNNQPYLILIN